jgi:hypothetical protein
MVLSRSIPLITVQQVLSQQTDTPISELVASIYEHFEPAIQIRH